MRVERSESIVSRGEHRCRSGYSGAPLPSPPWFSPRSSSRLGPLHRTGRPTVNGASTAATRARANTPRSIRSTSPTSRDCASLGGVRRWTPSSTARAPQMRAAGTFRSTPLMVDGVLYASNGVGFVEAFEPDTGKTLWVEPPLAAGANGYGGASTRGIGYWSDGDDARILVQHSEYLLALDPKTGQPISSFGTNGRVYLSEGMGADMRYTWTGAPFVIGDVVVLGMSPLDDFANKEATRSDVRAYDVRTGKLRWTFHVIPQAGEFGVETWEADSWRYSGHAPVWSLFSGDPELGLVYMPITAPTNDMYGGHRLGDNLFSAEHRRRGGGHGQTRLALPNRAPRSLGLRSAGSADPHGHPRRRLSRKSRRAAHETGVRLRVRSRNGRARVADRRASCAAVHGARRAHGADATDSDQAAGVRPARRHGGRTSSTSRRSCAPRRSRS